MVKNKKNSCENCAHFARHYIKSNSAQIVPINCGHCLNHYLSAKERRQVPNIYDCQSWQPKEIAETKKIQSIRMSIHFISQRLNEIVLLLNDKIDEVE